jgi:3-oxoacyl-[acyl-carrier protein] reductase
MTSHSSFAESPANTSSILEGKRAVVFGAGGSIGVAVAKVLAAEGAEVFLAGRSKSSVAAVTEQITKSGGIAHTHLVDALDETAVNAYVDSIVKQAGRIDILFNAVGPLAAEYGNGKQR